MALPMRVPEFDGWIEADLDALPEDGNRYELIDGSNWRVERHPEGPHLHAYELVDGEYVHVAWVRPGVAWQATSPYPVVLEPGTWAT